MNPFKLSIRLTIIALVIITIVFLSVITPFRGIGFMTTIIVKVGGGLWVASIILLIFGLVKQKGKRQHDYTNRKAMALLLIISLIPISFFYWKISGIVRKKIVVAVSNDSSTTAKNIKIYGTGSIFEKSDTLRVDFLVRGEHIIYSIMPVTKRNRSGHIVMEFDANDKHITKTIAGEFSTNPYRIQQNWRVIIDNELIR